MKTEKNIDKLSDVEKRQYLDEKLKNLIPKQAGKWLNLMYFKDINIIKDFIYPDSVTQLRPGTGKKGILMPGGPQYVVIHDTGMTHADDDADGLNRYFHRMANSPDGRVASWHFSVDQSKIYQHVPTDEIAWHAGDGSAQFGTKYFNTRNNMECIGGGNQNGIGIETCINPGNDYELTLKHTAKLTAFLLHKYHLGLDRIKQHHDFSGKQCPNVIRTMTGMWEMFLKDVELAYLLMAIDQNYQGHWEISHPNIVKESGLIIQPFNDTVVTLKLFLTLNGKEIIYEYQTFAQGMDDETKLSKIYFDLYNHIKKEISCDITLPIQNKKYQAVINWSSDKPEVLSSDGQYHKPVTAEKVTLSANIVINNKEYQKTFDVIVK